MPAYRTAWRSGERSTSVGVRFHVGRKTRSSQLGSAVLVSGQSCAAVRSPRSFKGASDSMACPQRKPSGKLFFTDFFKTPAHATSPYRRDLGGRSQGYGVPRRAANSHSYTMKTQSLPPAHISVGNPMQNSVELASITRQESAGGFPGPTSSAAVDPSASASIQTDPQALRSESTEDCATAPVSAHRPSLAPNTLRTDSSEKRTFQFRGMKRMPSKWGKVRVDELDCG